MKRRTFLKTAAAAAGVLLPAPFILSRQASAAIKWDLACEYPDSSFQVQMDHFFANRLAELSKGQIAISVQAGGALGYASKDQFDAVGDGAVQLADTMSGTMASADPLFKLSTLPFVARGADGAKRLWDVARPSYEAVFKKNGQKLLYATPDIPSGVWAKKPILAMADLAGLRLRTYDVNGTITFKAAGAAPLQISWGDVVPQLATNGLDAVLTGMEGGVMLALWEHVEYYTELDYARPLHMGHMNLNVFEDLSPELRDAVDEAAADTVEHIWTSQDQRVKTASDRIIANGIKIISEVSPELANGLTKAALQTRENWLKETGDAGQKILKSYGL